MLKPDERAHLLDLLRPPTGCQLDCAVGTTFSLDLLSALMLPLSFAFFDWEDSDGQLRADPLALLEALRRYGERFTLFCQSGQIRLPKQYPPLVAFLEPCIYDVLPRDAAGVFHPKVWALRFITPAGAVRYRVLCLSRNLTFDKCWDTVVALDGELEDRYKATAANHPLANLIDALPGLALRPLPPERQSGVARMANELRRVRFTWPEGFDEKQCRFWVGGLDGRKVSPFGSKRTKSLIISPFLANTVIRDFLAYGGDTHLVSRPEGLQDLPHQTLRDCRSVSILTPGVATTSEDEVDGAGRDEVLEGLHAKLFVIDRGWEASVFSGSFNATMHALAHNVEFMVELVGKKSRFGVDAFLAQVKGDTSFSDLLQPYSVTATALQTDATEQQLDEVIRACKRAIAGARPRLKATASGEVDLFDLSMEWTTEAPQWPDQSVEILAWPITQNNSRALPVDNCLVFCRLSYAGLTPMIAFSITARIGNSTGHSVFVMNLPLRGAPEDRHDRLVRSLIGDRDQLLRYIHFLLAAGDNTASSSAEMHRLLSSAGQTEQRNVRTPYLLETMLRALHRDPSQLKRVSSLLDVLRKAPDSSELLNDDFQKVWIPIWEVAQEVGAK